MKKFLLATLLLSSLLSIQAYAQPCTLSNLVITTSSSGGMCYATVTFNMDKNNGNKYVYIHLWNSANFAQINKSNFTSGHAPKKSHIDGGGHPSLATVSIDNSGTPEILTFYKPDNTVSVKTGTLNVVNLGGNNYRYTVSNIPIGTNVAGGCTSSNVQGAVWSTQANSTNSKIHCATITPSPTNTPEVTGTASCFTAKYTVTITNNGSTTITGHFDMYADNGGSVDDNIFDPGTLNTQDKLFDANIYFSVNPGGSLTYTGNIPSMYLGINLWAQVKMANNTTILRYIPSAACSPLPITLNSFKATRSGNNVVLKWETASEQNSSGFYVQRNIGGYNQWENVTFVASKAVGGNSSSLLPYEYYDQNSARGVSLYRIALVETTGSAKISDIRSVKGEGQLNKLLVYPNPSADGKINVLFEESDAVRDVIISDMSGKIVQQWRTVTNNNLQINNLMPGIYSLRVVDRNTGLQTVEKLVINKN